MLKTLGKTNIKINPIIMGCWQIGGAPYWQNINDNDSIAAILTAFDNGINAFDTAPGYGNGHSERILGVALKNKRKDVIITTKVFADKLSFNQVIHSCEDSLKNLQIDYIDLLQIHFPSGSFDSKKVPIEETLSAFIKLKNQGKICHIGVSNFSLDQLIEACQYTEITSIQPPYSLFWMTQAQALIPYCEQNKISILAYSPLAQGLLTGKFRQNYKFLSNEVRNKQVLYQPDHYARVQIALNQLEPIAKKNKMTLTELALSWLTLQPMVSAITGIRTAEQAINNAGIINLTLSKTDLTDIHKIGEKVSRYVKDQPLMWNF